MCMNNTLTLFREQDSSGPTNQCVTSFSVQGKDTGFVKPRNEKVFSEMSGEKHKTS